MWIDRCWSNERTYRDPPENWEPRVPPFKVTQGLNGWVG